MKTKSIQLPIREDGVWTKWEKFKALSKQNGFSVEFTGIRLFERALDEFMRKPDFKKLI